jgi:hypothetical protein
VSLRLSDPTAAAWIAKKPAQIPARLAAITASDLTSVAPMAAATTTDPSAMVAPLPMRWLSRPGTGPITIPIT